MLERLAIPLVVSILGGFLGAYLNAHYFKRAEMPIAIVDVRNVVEYVASTSPEGTDAAGIGVKQAQDLAKALSSEGFLVLEAQSVMGAPEEYYVYVKAQEAVR